MKRLVLAMVAIAAVACSGSTATSPSPASGGSTEVVVPDMADHGGRAMEAALSGAGVLPGPGDPDGSGTLNMTTNGGQSEICYALHTTDIGAITEVHLHRGAAGINGENVFTLQLPIDGYSRGCVDEMDRTLIHQILSSPAAYYIAVHTTEFPSGALRGQLTFSKKPYR